jgi:hypothetical protein
MSHPEQRLFDQEHTGDSRNKIRTGTYDMRKDRPTNRPTRSQTRPQDKRPRLSFKQRAKRSLATGAAIGAGLVVTHEVFNASTDKVIKAGEQVEKQRQPLQESLEQAQPNTDVAGSTELNPATPEDQTVEFTPDDSAGTVTDTEPQTGGVSAESTPDTGGLDAGSSAN